MQISSMSSTSTSTIQTRTRRRLLQISASFVIDATVNVPRESAGVMLETVTSATLDGKPMLDFGIPTQSEEKLTSGLFLAL